MDFKNEHLLKNFFEHKILFFPSAQDKSFIGTSGTPLPLYLDCRRIFSYPSFRRQLVDAWASHIQENALVDVDPAQIAVVGTATAGIAPAYALAEKMGLCFAYARGKSKEHGLKNQLEGAIPDSVTHFLVIDDMFTTGKSVRETLTAIEPLHKIPLVSTIAFYNLPKYPFSSHSYCFLFKVRDILLYGYQKGYVSEEQYHAVVRWMEQR